jgi:hypothetical protein
MSRNSKNARRVEQRKQWTAVRKGGGGPSQTEAKHGKKRAWFQLYEDHGAYMASMKKGGKKAQRRDDDEESTPAVAAK